MKSYELESTNKNILETLYKDPLGRNKDLFRFVEIINSIDFSCSIALDGEWGAGKTFFVKQAKEIFDVNNRTFEADEESVALKSMWSTYATSRNLELESTISVYYDAWTNDNDVDPILSIIYEILRQLEIKYSFNSKLDSKKIIESVTSGIVKHFTGVEIQEFFTTLETNDALSDIKEQKDLHEQISQFFDEILKERGNRLVIFIDELDRCKPDYAVRLLERIKHYFNNERVTFVFAVNIGELQHTIKRYYGDGFDSTRYLDRFFDLRTSMPKVDLQRYFEIIDFPHTSYVVDEVCINVIKKHNFSLREVERYLRIVKMAVGKTIHNGKLLGTGFAEENGQALLATYFVPIMLGMRVTDAEQYNEFIHGKDGSCLVDSIGEDLWHAFDTMLLDDNESFYQEQTGTRTVINLSDRIQQLYEAVFCNRYDDGSYERKIGKVRYTKESKDKLMNMVNLFANVTVLDD